LGWFLYDQWISFSIGTDKHATADQYTDPDEYVSANGNSNTAADAHGHTGDAQCDSFSNEDVLLGLLKETPARHLRGCHLRQPRYHSLKTIL
jgi:hypothetical protein